MKTEEVLMDLVKFLLNLQYIDYFIKLHDKSNETVIVYDQLSVIPVEYQVNQ